MPSQFLGSIPVDSSTTFDLAAAKAALAKSGYRGQTLTLTYPSDSTLDGIAFGTLAQKVQTQLEAVGIKVKLNGVPVDTMLAAYRADKLQAGLDLLGARLPGPLRLPDLQRRRLARGGPGRLDRGQGAGGRRGGAGARRRP